MLKKLLLAILLFSSMVPLLGQSDFRDGFIITIENDTIYGSVDFRTNTKNYKSCLFKDESGKMEYFHDQIKGYGLVNEKFYMSGVKENTFVEILVLGPISLYRYNETFIANKGEETLELTSENIEKKVKGRTEIKRSNKWKGLLNYLIADCLSNPAEITAKLDFSEKDITKTIVKYNRCAGVDFIEMKSDIPWTEIDLGVIVGISKSDIKISDATLSEYIPESYQSIFPMAGIVVSVASPRILKSLAFQTEFQFSSSNYSAFLETFPPAFHETFIDLRTISIPLSFTYSLPENKFGWFVQGGANYDFNIRNKVETYTDNIYTDVVFSFIDENPFKIRKVGFGIFGGIGVYKTFKKIKINLTGRYLYKPYFSDLVTSNSSNSLFSINLLIIKI